MREFDPDFVVKQKRPQAVPIGEAQRQLRGGGPAAQGSDRPLSPTTLSPTLISPVLSPKARPNQEVLQEKLNLEKRLSQLEHQQQQSGKKKDSESGGLLSPRLKGLLSPKSKPKNSVEDVKIERAPPTLIAESPTGAAPSSVHTQTIAKDAVVSSSVAGPDLAVSEEPGSVKDPLWTEERPKYEPINDTVFCVVIEPVMGEREDDLSLSVGQVVLMNACQDFREEWWFGSAEFGDGTAGYFPQSAVNWLQRFD